MLPPSLGTAARDLPPPMIHELVAGDLATAEYVSALQRYAEQSRAVHHPLLEAIATGQFRSPRATLERFFREYYVYSRRFTRYLAAVMATLEQPEHRAALVPNTAEESGQLDAHHRAELSAAGIDPDDVSEPHPALFRRFLAAISLRTADLETAVPHVATAAWIHSFEALCRADQATAVGALGVATEGIVRIMYQKLLAGIRRAWPDLNARDRAFFELHALVDDDHAEALRRVAEDLCSTPAGRRGLAVGVLAALDARASFYDQIHAYLVAAEREEVA